MNYNVFVTDNFKKEAKPLLKKYQSLKIEIENLVKMLKTKPETGISLGKDCYKIRLAIKSKGKGKSGGARVITTVKVQNEAVYLLSIYDKSKKETIIDNELQEIIDKEELT